MRRRSAAPVWPSAQRKASRSSTRASTRTSVPRGNSHHPRPSRLPSRARPSGPLASVPDLAHEHFAELEEDRAHEDAEAAARQAEHDEEPARPMRPSLAGLPMLVDDQEFEPPPSARDAQDDGGTIG